jgi:tetratricopeptide (TPR) repeat protein
MLSRMLGSRRVVASWLVALLSSSVTAQEVDGDWTTLLTAAQQQLHKGQLSSAESAFEDLAAELDAEPVASRPQAVVDAVLVGLWTISLAKGRYEKVRDGVRAADERLRTQRPAMLLLAQAHRRVGEYGAAVKVYETLVARDAQDLEARHELGEAFWSDGLRTAARATWAANAAAEATGAVLAWRGRSLFRLGGRANLEASSRDLVAALAAEPKSAAARITLGLCKFAAYGEAAGLPSGEKELKAVLDECGDLEEALLAMYRIRSANMALDGGKTERFLERVLDRNDRCVPALMLRAANVLDDRRYRDAARLLDVVLAIDPNDRLVLCHRAAAAFLLHDHDAYAGFRARALAGDPGFAECDRILGDHLCALYRFADALPFYTTANMADPEDLPTLHGFARALVYTGAGAQAKELLERAKAKAAGLVDPWRNNMLAVQDLLDTEYVAEEHGDFRIQIHRDDVEVLTQYLVPIQLEAAQVLGAKYQWRPQQPGKIEVFHTWDDFSVRTIGFRGFTALGACFGRLTTLVSPVDADLRRQEFMWEATAWHEYTHVLTLGVSNHRVPRWLTEGFSVYEEKARDPSWERGMDRELFDAFHNQDIPPVHLMNRLFRGPRILFGYYQGGLVVEWIQKHHGFDKALALLRAFGEDLDTEEAFQKALGMAARDFDRQFLEWVEREKLRGMRLVPRLDYTAMQRRIVDANRDKTNLQARVDLAWACVQQQNPVDAGRWLGEVLRADPEHGQGMLIRAALLRQRKEPEAAIEHYRRGFAAGADDFDSRVAFGRLLLHQQDEDGAIEQWQRAKACWPACTEQDNAPELLLAALYRDRGDRAQAQMEMKAYCRRTGRAYTPRWTLAGFERDSGNRAEEARLLVECNRIDPFHRDLHVRLGEAFEALGKTAQAALEFEVAAAVGPAQDRRYLRQGTTRPAPDAPDELDEKGGLWLRAAKLRRTLGDAERAVQLVERIGKEAMGRPVVDDARAWMQEWRGK